jgi:hypothetical protein
MWIDVSVLYARIGYPGRDMTGIEGIILAGARAPARSSSLRAYRCALGDRRLRRRWQSGAERHHGSTGHGAHWRPSDSVNNGANALAATLQRRRLSGRRPMERRPSMGDCAVFPASEPPGDSGAATRASGCTEEVVAAHRPAPVPPIAVIADPTTRTRWPGRVFRQRGRCVNDPGDKGNGHVRSELHPAARFGPPTDSRSRPSWSSTHRARHAAKVLYSGTRITLTARGLTIDGTDRERQSCRSCRSAERNLPDQHHPGSRRNKPTAKADPSPCNDNSAGRCSPRAGQLPSSACKSCASNPKNQLPPPPPPPSQICCGNLDLSLSCGAASAYRRSGQPACLDGAVGSAQRRSPKAQCQATSKDCRQRENTGSTRSHPIVAATARISYCLDRGVKSKNNFLRLDNQLAAQQPALWAVSRSCPAGRSRRAATSYEENGLN